MEEIMEEVNMEDVILICFNSELEGIIANIDIALNKEIAEKHVERLIEQNPNAYKYGQFYYIPFSLITE